MKSRFPSARSALLLLGVVFAVIGCATTRSVNSASERDSDVPAASPGPARSFPSDPVQAP